MSTQNILERLTKWERTNDKYGLKPRFNIICHHCKVPMFLRNSELLHDKLKRYGFVRLEPILSVRYKCIPCAQVYFFVISRPHMDTDYWNEVLKWRDMQPLFIPPMAEWSDDAKIQQKLKDLGYLGGDVAEELTKIEGENHD